LHRVFASKDTVAKARKTNTHYAYYWQKTSQKADMGVGQWRRKAVSIRAWLPPSTLALYDHPRLPASALQSLSTAFSDPGRRRPREDHGRECPYRMRKRRRYAVGVMPAWRLNSALNCWT